MFSIVHLECDSPTWRCPVLLSPHLHSGHKGKGRKVVVVVGSTVLADPGRSPDLFSSVAVHTRTVAVTPDISPAQACALGALRPYGEATS